MPLTITQVDSFTATPFAGNPAAVCLLDRPAPDRWMQAVAAEMNLAETAFLVAEGEGGDSFALRWFTPTVEVDLCGHATLASAHVLWESGRLDRARTARFSTRSGALTASLGADGWITLDFPAQPIGPAARDVVEEARAALGLVPSDIASGWMGGADLIVEVDSPWIVRSARPDFARLAAVEARGVIVTSRAEADDCDFVSRFFGPRVGVPEDPVTGSAHCALGPFWMERLGRRWLTGHQLSSRGGFVRVEVAGDRVRLGGQAVTVFQAELAAVAAPG